jgi:hypothetical protein
MEGIKMFRNYVFVCAAIVLSIVVSESIVPADEGSFNVKEQNTPVSVAKKNSKAIKEMKKRGLASAQKAVLMADPSKGVYHEIKQIEKELNELAQRKEVLGQVIKKLKVARFRVQCREKANPSVDSEVLSRRLQDFAYQINNQKKDLAEIEARIPVLKERLEYVLIEKEKIEIFRGKDTDGLDVNLDTEFEAEIRKRWERGSVHINLSSLIDYP